MNVFIVDDEKPAREELRWLLDQCERVETVGEAAGAEEARDELDTIQPPPDVVFLDIDMPNIDGIRFAECLENVEPSPLPIFVTAYEEYAVDAFGVEAVDYVLKPVRLERLQTAVDRARRRLRNRADGDHTPDEAVANPAGGADGEPLDRISVRDDGQFRVVETGEILYFESEDGEVFVETERGRYPTDFSLKALESKLDSEEFFRSHRSYIVRIDAIENIVPTGAGTYRLEIAGSESGVDPLEAPLARSRAGELKRRIPWSAAMLEE